MKIKLLLGLLSLQLLVLGQSKFTVFKNQGEVMYFGAKTKNWQLLKLRDTINQNTKIKINPGAILIVFDSVYRIYEIKQPGEFLMKNALGNAMKAGSEEMQKAVKYFVQQTFTSSSNSNNQKSKGAVYRGEESVFPWDGTIIIDDTFEVDIDLSKTSYPVKVSLNGYQAMVYNDTVLRIPASFLPEKGNSVLKIGNKERVMLTRDAPDRAMILNYIASLTNPESKPEAIHYALVILHCINASYYDAAHRLIEKVRSDPSLFAEVKSLIDDNATVKMLMK